MDSRHCTRTITGCRVPWHNMARMSMESSLTRYVSHCLAVSVATTRQAHSEATMQRVEGVALVLDIAGFSTLTEQLVSLGPRGVERLSSILDAYFGQMTGIAIDHGGDVVDFVGDGIIVTWHA